MKSKYFLILIFFCSFYNCRITTAQFALNGNFEQIDPKTKLPAGWNSFMSPDLYDFKLDSTVVYDGKYSISISPKTKDGNFGAISCVIPYTFEGHELQLKGFIKTENVTEGYAGLWLRVDGTTAFNNMADQNIHGTTDWHEYTITLPYNNESAININAGALLVGKGKMWFDNLRLYLDGTPIEKAKFKKPDEFNAANDTAYQNNSGIGNIALSNAQINNLSLLGQVWGFVKYYHPAVAKGDINMDAELFRVMPDVIKGRNYPEACAAIEKWIDKLRVRATCANCKPINNQIIAQNPSYAEIFDTTVVTASLSGKLSDILKNNSTGTNYYIAMFNGIGNPDFKHERAYTDKVYPDAGYRLLCLFRYWNMIQYFYPYKHLIGRKWETVLQEFIPKFMDAKDTEAYELTTLALISSIHDTHANIWSAHRALENYRGKYAPPFRAKFIEGKLTVTAYYNDTLSVKEKVKLGDVINRINGVTVDELIHKYLPVTAASNYETQLRDMPRVYLLRANKPAFRLEIVRDGKTLTVDAGGIEFNKLNTGVVYDPNPGKPGYFLLNNGIGYLYPGKYFDKDLPAIKKMFRGTKGIIIDMRCYPSEFMPFTFVPYIKSGQAPFVKFTNGSISLPGLFTETQPLQIEPQAGYKNKVVVIVNEVTQSQAEYTTMAFQSSPNVTVIGSTTAGADGDVSAIILPGGISTMISGIGILYPDGTETQRKGIKIDVVVKPTIEGIKAGRDELLEKAKAIIMGE